MQGDGGAGGVQPGGRVGLVILDGRAQAAQGLAQVLEGHGLGVVRPQQPGQRLAAMGDAGVHGQVGQQRLRRVGAKSDHGFTVQGDPKGTEQRDL